MAFVSFLRKAMDGVKNPIEVPIKDGQFVVDTNKGYMYTDVGNNRIPIVDRKDANRISNDEDLKSATHNGWYYLDYGIDNETEKEKEFTIDNINGYSEYKITGTSGHLSVDGSNNNFINQTLYLHNINKEGHILTRYTEDGGNAWSNWEIQDKIVKIDGSQWGQMRTPGNYYFDNREFKTTTIGNQSTEELNDYYCKPIAYGHTYEYDYYYMRVESYSTSRKYCTITLYPVTNDPYAPYFQRRSYYNNEELTLSNWEIHSYSNILVVESTYNIDNLRRTGLYLIKSNDSDKRKYEIGGMTFEYSRALLDIKGWQRDAYNTYLYTIQTLYLEDNNTLQILSRTCRSDDNNTWSEWKPLYMEDGILLNSGNKDTKLDDNNIKALPQGNYLLSSQNYELTTTNCDLISKNVKITTARLSVIYFYKSYIEQTLSFKATTVATRDAFGVPDGTEICLKRVRNGDNDFSKWTGINEQDYSIKPNKIDASSVLAEINNKYNLKTGFYKLSMEQAQSINNYKFQWATVEIKRYGSTIRAFLYPTNSNYTLYARCTLSNDNKVPSGIEWKWDPSNCPKITNEEYPLVNGQYYYKYTIHRDSYEEQKNKKNTFQIYNNTNINNNSYPFVQCMNLPSALNKKNVIIEELNIVKDAQTIGLSNVSSIHILNTTNNNNMTLQDYINSLRINKFPSTYKIIDQNQEELTNYLDRKMKELAYTTPKLLLISQKDNPDSEYYTIEVFYRK